MSYNIRGILRVSCDGERPDIHLYLRNQRTAEIHAVEDVVDALNAYGGLPSKLHNPNTVGVFYYDLHGVLSYPRYYDRYYGGYDTDICFEVLRLKLLKQVGLWRLAYVSKANRKKREAFNIDLLFVK